MGGELTFAWTEEEYVAAAKDFYLASLRTPRVRRRFVAITAIAAVIGASTAFLDHAPGRMPLLLLGFAAGGALYLSLIYGLCYLTVPRRTRQLFRQQKTAGRSVRVAWTKDGVSIEASNGSSRVKWTELYQWAEGKNAFLLYHNDQLYNFVPRRLLPDQLAADLRGSLERNGVRRV
jgi:hypothetical protein